MIITLEYLKKHLRLDATDTSEDATLEMYMQGANDVILKAINQTEDELFDEYGSIPPALKNAVCMLTATLYQNREATVNTGISINPAMMAMVRPYKKIVR